MASFKGFMQKAFPFISAAASVGGPIGTIAANAVGTALKLNAPPDPANLEETVAQAAPDQTAMQALAQAEQQLAQQLQTFGVQKPEDIQSLANADRADARAREIAVRDSTPQQLAWLIIGGFLVMSSGIIIGLFVWPDRAKLLLAGEAGLFFGTVYGYLANEAKQAASYYFGSSAGSDAKTKILGDIAKS